MRNRFSCLRKAIAKTSITTYSSIVIAFFLLMSAVVFPLRLFRNAPITKTARGANGYVSLMDETALNEVIKLHGEWEFYPNELYTFDDFTYGRTGACRLVNFPHYWKNEPGEIIENVGYATYRMRVRIPSSFDGIGIYSREQYSAYEIFVNDISVCGAGEVNANLDKYKAVFLPTNGYTYSTSAIGAQGRTFSIILHVQNAALSYGGFSRDIFIGSANSIKELKTVLLMSNGLISGGLLLLSFCYIVIFLSGRQRKEYHDYTIVSLLALFVSLTMGGEKLMYSSGIDNIFLKRFEYCALVIGAFFANYGVLKSTISSRRVLVAIQAYVVFATLFFLFAPLMLSSMLKTPLIVVCVLFFAVPFFNVVRSIAVKREYALITSAASYIIVFTGMFLTISGGMPWDSVDLFSVGMMVFCILQMVMFLSRYRKVEEALHDMTQTLEDRIEQRTFELTIMKERAEAATVAKSNFLATMSHEIRTPMNAIMGIADIMRTDNLDSVQQSYLVSIKKSSKALLQIINDILDFSKIEAGKLELNPSHFSLLAMYDNICSICRFSADAKCLEFRHSFASDVPHYLYADEVRCRQIIINIINNGIKYTKEGFIDFSIEKTQRGGEPFLAFAITDTGVGIREEDFGKLFDTFEQLDSLANRKIEGTGLGLSITKQLVELMNGYIELKSEYGKGSTFTVLLPLILGDKNKVSLQEAYVPIYAKGADVLVVDDIEINLTVATGFLALHGIHPDTALSAAEAIKKIQQKHYDIVFMDHMMPEMDGTEATRIIRSLDDPASSSTPIIALTANAVTGARDTLRESGMNDFLSKPIEAAHLNKILAKYLPKEKISCDASAQDMTEKSDEFTAVHDALSSIEGLNLEEGIAHTAFSEGAYLSILRQYCGEINQYLKDIALCLSCEQWSKYCLNLHAVKGVLATIGATELSKWAYELETASREKNYDVPLSETENFIKKVRALGDALIEAGVIQGSTTHASATPISADELTIALDKLQGVCIQGDSDSAEAIVSELENRTFSKEIDAELHEIFMLARSYDFALVSTKIHGLVRQIN